MGPFVPCAERWPRARRRLATRSTAGPLSSSEAEIGHPLEGRSVVLERGGDAIARSRVPRGALERGGDRPEGPRGVRMGRMLGFFESFTFFHIGRRPWGFMGPVALTCVCVFQSDFSIMIRVSLIVVPDSSHRGFGRVKGFGQRVIRQFPP